MKGKGSQARKFWRKVSVRFTCTLCQGLANARGGARRGGGLTGEGGVVFAYGRGLRAKGRGLGQPDAVPGRGLPAYPAGGGPVGGAEEGSQGGRGAPPPPERNPRGAEQARARASRTIPRPPAPSPGPRHTELPPSPPQQQHQHSGILAQPGPWEAGAPRPWMSRSAAASVRRAGEGARVGGGAAADVAEGGRRPQRPDGERMPRLVMVVLGGGSTNSAPPSQGLGDRGLAQSHHLPRP